MPTEEEKRLRRCCFAGHALKDIPLPEEEVARWLREQIFESVEEGYATFITGLGMGVDLMAAKEVLELKGSVPSLHLIAMEPYPAFAAKWNDEWRRLYREVRSRADIVKRAEERYTPEALDERNRWMADHSRRMIVIYNGRGQHTGRMIEYAAQRGLDIVRYPFEGKSAEEEK